MKCFVTWKSAVVVTLALNAAALIAHEARAGQPNMQAALQSLHGARQALEAAVADKGGHRANAIRLVDEAIAETKAGIEFDRTH